MPSRSLLPALLAVLALPALAQTAPDAPSAICAPITVKGKVVGPANAAIPGGARLDMRLYDSGLADAPASMTTAARIERPVRGRFPIAYTLKSGASRCLHMPAVSATITHRGKLLFLNDTSIQVSRQGADGVDVPVIRVK
ncbi:YbaY family lipoprotein [Burkholderia alba]|uniref:YbaY family lipoprotein n=1 Tax=Burkholderia alba TaxID=2683677 RepID=UPI002B05A0DF|nr:YbaY family lipoprotein [Burkholderia alba]